MVFLRVCLIVFSIAVPIQSIAQDDGIEVFLKPKKFYKKFFPNLKITKPAFDSTYIKTYPNYLTTGTSLILPTLDLDLVSENQAAAASTSKFRTNIGSILAFKAGYRFISAGFAMLVSSDTKNKKEFAPTSFRTATIKYNGAAFYLQFRYMRTIGFTDINENNNVNPLTVYTQRRDLRSKEYQFEGMYNFHWKKYSYYAAIDYTQRQLKSSVGMLLKAGAYYNELSANADLLTSSQKSFFEEFDDVQQIRSTSLKLAPGIGANLVFMKKVYLSAAVFTPYNLYVYNNFTKDDTRIKKGVSVAKVLDASASFGYQSERIYAGVRYQGDSKRLKMDAVTMNTKFNYVGFDIGYRFKAPRIVKKVYKETMPPGM